MQTVCKWLKSDWTSIQGHPEMCLVGQIIYIIMYLFTYLKKRLYLKIIIILKILGDLLMCSLLYLASDVMMIPSVICPVWVFLCVSEIILVSVNGSGKG